VLGIDRRSFEVYVPFHTLVSRNGMIDYQLGPSNGEASRVELHQIVCEVRAQEEVLAAADCIEAILKRFHERQDYQATVPLELLASMERTQRVFNVVLPIIAGISLLVGGIGILNIMLASVTERTREIGIRRAIGATQLDITVQFLIETITLAGIGGIAGVGAGVAGVLALERFTEWAPVVTPAAVALSLAISCTTGIVFGLYPARRAALMNPIQALRHD
jgi:putative ABC transport system permease protein